MTMDALVATIGVMTAPSDHVGNIIGVRTPAEMLRVDAYWIVTRMKGTCRTNAGLPIDLKRNVGGSGCAQQAIP